MLAVVTSTVLLVVEVVVAVGMARGRIPPGRGVVALLVVSRVQALLVALVQPARRQPSFEEWVDQAVADIRRQVSADRHGDIEAIIRDNQRRVHEAGWASGEVP